jgi:hypothetical protein
MKKIIYSIFLIVFAISSCEVDLKRDNPLDTYNNSKKDSTNNNSKVGPLNFTKYFVLNGDTIKAGAWLYMKVFVKNIGSAIATDVVYEITSNSSYCNLVSFGKETYGSIVAGQEVMLKPYRYGNDYTIYFRIDASTPVGTQIKFSLNMNDYKNNQWNESFDITTVQ